MVFPIIKIKQNVCGEEMEHIVGTNSHDCLYIENNAIHYLNVQGMIGTQYPEESGMYFTGEDRGEYSFSGSPEVEFMTLEEIIKLATKNMKEQTENTIKLYELLGKHNKEKEKCKKQLEDCKKKTEIKGDTSGNLY